MPWYRTGTIAVSAGSAAVAGTGTSWLTSVKPGESLVGPDGLPYEILSVTSNVAMTLGSLYKGATVSGAPYAVLPTAANLKALAAQVASLVLLYQDVSNNPAVTALAARVAALEAP